MTSGKTRRLAALLGAAALAVAACGGATPSAEPSSAPSEAPSQAASQDPLALPAPEFTGTLRIGLSNTEMSEWSAILGVEEKLFEKYGVKAEYAIFEGDAKVVAALQAGQIDLGVHGVSSAISSALTDVPLVVIGVNALILTDDLVCQGSIKTVEDLKDKTIAISTFGGTSDGAAIMAIKAAGLSQRDMVRTTVGTQGARLAALEGGSVDCAIVDTNKQAQMKEKGFSIMVELKKSGIPWGRAGTTTTKDFAAKYPNTLLAVMAAQVEAQNLIWTKPEVVIPIHQRVTQSTPEEAELQVKDFPTVGNRTLIATLEAFDNPRRVGSTINIDLDSVNAEDVWDGSFLQQLVDRGFYEALGIPLS